MKRGDIENFSADKVSCVKWMDNRAVMLLSNFISPKEHIIVKRRKAGTADRIEVKCPEMVVRYNKYMGGVDLMDQLKTSFLDSAIFRRHLRKIKFLQYFHLPNLDIPFKKAKNVYDVLFVVKMGLKVELITIATFVWIISVPRINEIALRDITISEHLSNVYLRNVLIY